MRIDARSFVIFVAMTVAATHLIDIEPPKHNTSPSADSVSARHAMPTTPNPRKLAPKEPVPQTAEMHALPPDKSEQGEEEETSHLPYHAVRRGMPGCNNVAPQRTRASFERAREAMKNDLF